MADSSNTAKVASYLTVLLGTCRGGGAGHPTMLHKAPVPSYHVRGSYDKVRYRQARRADSVRGMFLQNAC